MKVWLPKVCAATAAVGLLVLLALGGVGGFAQSTAPVAPPQPPPRSSRGEILHERLPIDPVIRGASGDSPLVVYDPSQGPGEWPEGEAASLGGLPAPGGDAERGGEGGLAAPDDFVYGASNGEGAEDPTAGGAEASDVTAMDRKTEREGMLEYHAVFDPSVVPFKRNLAQDKALADFSLQVGQRDLKPVPIEPGGAKAGSELFWGQVRLDLKRGEATPIPSVAPEVRIVELQLSPAAPGIQVLKDGADNYFITAEADGRHRLQVLMEAPSHYFGGNLPRGVPLSEARFGFAGAFYSPPAAVMNAAPQVWRAIGVSPQGQLADTLEALVGWFRGFEPGEPPSDTGNLFVDISLGRRGVCRHRTHAFVLTAQSLGIAARYVSNEAHVFAEVWLPGSEGGWRRIDLGGGAEGLTVYGGGDRAMHQPAAADPFNAEFGNTALAGAQEVFGLPSSGANDLTRSLDTKPGWSEYATGESTASGTMLRLQVGEASVFRGEALDVWGELRGPDGRPAAGAHIALLLAPVGPAGGESRRLPLGGAETGTSGTFTARVPIPADLSPGRWRLVARTDGTPESGPASTD